MKLLLQNNPINHGIKVFGGRKVLFIGSIGHIGVGETTLIAAIKHSIENDKTFLFADNPLMEVSEFPSLDNLAPYQKPFVINAPRQIEEDLVVLSKSFKDGKQNRRERRKNQRKK